MRHFVIAGMMFFSATASPAWGEDATFSKGPLIEEFGPHAAIDGASPIASNAQFNVSFDVKKQAAAGETSRHLESGARFLNMHAAAGVKPENMRLAFVIHGAAVRDVTHNEFYRGEMNSDNSNLALIKSLLRNNVSITVCGQSAAYYGVTKDDLAPGVEMALSAMTAHAQLQQQGYTVNPF